MKLKILNIKQAVQIIPFVLNLCPTLMLTLCLLK